jgi:hypothetical protein
MYERLAGGLGERCLSQPLPHTNDGRAECVLWQLSDTACDCKAAGLEEVELSARASVEQMLRFECAFRQRECETMCACQVPQLSGRELSECQTNAVATGINGWCSIDPSQGVGSSEFVSDCRAGQPRTLRLLGTVEALKDNHLLLTCPE